MRIVRQKEAEDSWLQSQRNSIIYASPRMGKTKIGIEIIKNTGFKKVLIAYPNLPIKDSWISDIQKFEPFMGSTMEFSTFLSLNKALDKRWDLIVLDEVHMLSEAQIRVIRDYKALFPGTQFLGLTGTLAESTKSTLYGELDMDICYTYPIEQAVKEGVISDYLIEIHLVKLDDKLLKPYTQKKVMRTEKQHFDHLGRTIDWMESSDKNTFFKRLERMRLIQNSVAKLNKTKDLLHGRNLVFCGTTAVADQLGCAVYHNKSNEKQIFEDFCNGKIDQMAVCKMLNMGVTINNLNRVILNYTDSNEENLIQKICRCLNYDYKDKTAKITLVSSTEEVELKWIKRAISSLDQNKIIWI